LPSLLMEQIAKFPMQCHFLLLLLRSRQSFLHSVMFVYVKSCGELSRYSEPPLPAILREAETKVFRGEMRWK
jgi:hypothetical protein